MKNKPVNQIEFDERIEIVSELILKGYSTKEIQRYADELLWGVTRRQIDNYVKQAKEKIISQTTADEIRFEMNLTLNRLELLWKNSLELQDYKTALSVIEKRAKLLNLENIPTADNTLKITHNIMINGQKSNIEYDNDIIDFKYDV